MVDGNIFEYLNQILFGEIQKYCYAQFMRKLLAITTSLLCLFGSVQSAHGCTVPSNLTRMDVAFADIIFEGSLNSVDEGNLIFDVSRVVRGDYLEPQIAVGMRTGSSYERPGAISEFIEQYGNITRVAVTTPRQAKLFCTRILEKDDRVLGDLVETADGWEPICDYPLPSLTHAKAKQIPIVIDPGFCGQPYLYSVEIYEKRRNYGTNSNAFETLVKQGLPKGMDDWEYYQALERSRPLPWNQGSYGFENEAIRIFQKNADAFERDFTSFENQEELLTALGVDLDIIRENIETRLAETAGDNTATLEKLYQDYLERLLFEIKLIKTVLDKDPSFADRLLEAD